MAYIVYEWIICFIVVFICVVLYNHTKCLYREFRNGNKHGHNKWMYVYHIAIIVFLVLNLILFI